MLYGQVHIPTWGTTSALASRQSLAAAALMLCPLQYAQLLCLQADTHMLV